MDVYVAIDISDGKVVRLTRGDMNARTVYDDDPASAAAGWTEQGARYLHVVDLDGALTGEPVNAADIERIIDAVDVPVQVSGGLRTVEACRSWLDRGAARVVVGTRAVDPPFLGEALLSCGDRLVVAIDAGASGVRTSGWTHETGIEPYGLAARMSEVGVARILFTSIERDGTMRGPDLAALVRMLDAASVPVLVSGGVSSVEHLRELAPLATRGLEGVVVGKAIYSGALALKSLMEAAGD